MQLSSSLLPSSRNALRRTRSRRGRMAQHGLAMIQVEIEVMRIHELETFGRLKEKLLLVMLRLNVKY